MSRDEQAAATTRRRWWFFNYCVECGVRIPRRKRAFFGNAYRPVVCRACCDRQRAALHGTVEAADAALLGAAADLMAEHPELKKYARGLS